MTTELGIRPRAPFPEQYKEFRLIRTHGRVYGIPPFLGPEEILKRGQLHAHPGVLSAATREELEILIDGFDDKPYLMEHAGSHAGYDLVYYRGSVYGIPQSAGRVDLNLEDDCRRAGVLRGATMEEVRDRIRTLGEAVPVEFAGWLPIFEWSGNCGRHPQFGHTATPPQGYHFTRSAPSEDRDAEFRPKNFRRRCAAALTQLRDKVGRSVQALGRMFRPLRAAFRSGPRVSLLARLRVLSAIASQFVRLVRSGTRIVPALRFLQSRHYHSQLLMAEQRGLVFLTSIPYTYGQNPWVIEIEDPTTLFYPFIQNGCTLDLRPRESPIFPAVKALLESDQCRGILTHIRSTAEMVPTLFGSEKIARKVFYAPLGVKVPARWQRHDGPDEPEHLDLLFINSWCQVPENFYVRGGLDVLEAFAILRERYPHLRLTLRTNLPVLDAHYHRLVEAGWVRVINRFLSPEEMAALHADSHIFLLPAARIHIVSLLQAMSYGLAVVGSDGWGIEEYLEHEHNGLVVKGRYGKTSWADNQAGFLREDYEPIYTSDPEVVQGLVEAVSRLAEDANLRRRLGRNARRDVETTYSLDCWNRGLKEMLDRALAPAS